MDYQKTAADYARHRAASSFVIDELIRGWKGSPESTVLEVGCGTGSHLLSLIKVSNCTGWGIDPSIEMMCHAPYNKNANFINGAAEQLPFKDECFDFIFTVNVIHHMDSTQSYFQDALRTLKIGGLICTVTDSERIIKNRRPLSKYWPGTVTADLGRYPPISLLRQQMAAIGFVDLREHLIQSRFRVVDITPYRDKAFSCLYLISNNEFEDGLRHLETDLKTGPIKGLSQYLCLWGRK